MKYWYTGPQVPCQSPTLQAPKTVYYRFGHQQNLLATKLPLRPSDLCSRSAACRRPFVNPCNPPPPPPPPHLHPPHPPPPPPPPPHPTPTPTPPHPPPPHLHPTPTPTPTPPPTHTILQLIILGRYVFWWDFGNELTNVNSVPNLVYIVPGDGYLYSPQPAVIHNYWSLISLTCGQFY